MAPFLGGLPIVFFYLSNDEPGFVNVIPVIEGGSHSPIGPVERSSSRPPFPERMLRAKPAGATLFPEQKYCEHLIFFFAVDF